ncbi:protein CYP58C1 [Aspergillus nidulans FGSC A4]|uniref:Cytochrome P450, putative (Eurofung) n=1 Tax=Emericella nidulans (strain FGSC A4 / ATCC 38163 / CBS 112.46 / NRRL 194 / M139) TaxID=227321 RepID=C8VGR4_EMENI|nr:protein CYP58C1 [Aspergillus nidulans FGSC A4]CBF82038.1 TPA: cytochrome P450, putative (Eurofung) [Aspergillus nidulans FGSC A4]
MTVAQWMRWEVPLLLIISFYLTRTVYRLFFHPLTRFPGPKITAATGLYEFYHDVVRGGKFLWEIEQMHQVYGPIVRITPWEIHVKDPHFYDEIYTSARKCNKDPNFVGMFGSPTSMIATVDHGHHRFRRGILSSFFSKRSIRDISPLIRRKVQRLMERLAEFYQTDTEVDLSAAFAALTADIISTYSYGESFDFLEDGSFHSEVRDAIMETEKLDHISRLFPVVLTVIRHVPVWAFAIVKPATAVIAGIQKRVAEKSAKALKMTGSSKEEWTMFDALTDPKLPACERTMSRIHDEGMILLSGGTEPTANALTVAAFHMINQKDILTTIREEVRASGRDVKKASLAELEQLPYLTAVVNEALRLSHGLSIRSPRISPTEALTYKSYVIPAGTPVGMSNYFVHMDPSIFPHPASFNPNRWIEASKRGEKLDRFITAFGKGSRQCIGINLGYAELYFALASFATFFDYQLHDTTEENVRVARDRGVPFPEAGHLTCLWRMWPSEGMILKAQISPEFRQCLLIVATRKAYARNGSML